MSCATVVPLATYVSPFAAHIRIPNFYEPSSTQIPETHEPKAHLVDGDKYGTVVDEVFDENPPSNETAMHFQFSKDETQLVPHVGRDSFVPKEIEQIETLSVDSKEIFDAMKINSDSDDGESEEDQRGCTKVEEYLSNSVDQLVAKNPQQNTNEQLIRFAPMIMDPFASLVPGDKFPFCQILVMLVSVNLNHGHMRDIYYCCHMRACTYLYCAYESRIGVIPFCSCVDDWFDTGQDFKADSCVLLYIESEDLYRNEEFLKTRVITSNMNNLEDGQFEGSFLSLGFHCKPTLKEDFKNILWFQHDFKIHLDYWCDNGRGHNLSGFLLCKLRVPAREEKVQGVLQEIAQSYSKQSPSIRVNRVVRLLFAMSGLVHKARSTSPYIIFDPGGVNTSLCATSEQLLFRLVKYLTIEYYDATQHYMKTQPATVALAAILLEWEVLELRSAYKLKLQAVQSVGYTFFGVTKNGAIERYGGEEASKTVYPYFKVDNSSVDRSEHVKGCCLYYSAFRIPFDPSSALDGVLDIQLSEAIPYIVAYHVNIAFDREGNDSTMTTTDSTADSFPLVQANTMALSFSPETCAEEEWTARGIADTITILISYMRMSISVCITLGDNPCLSSSYNSLWLNALTDWEIYNNLLGEFQVQQKVSFHLTKFMLWWRLATGMFTWDLSFSLRLNASTRWQAKTYTWQITMAVQLTHMVLSIKGHNDQCFDWFIKNVSDHIFSSSHKACLGFEIIGWELASINILDLNLEDKVLIEDGSIVMNQRQPNLIQVAIGLTRVIGPRTSSRARLIWNHG